MLSRCFHLLLYPMTLHPLTLTLTLAQKVCECVHKDTKERRAVKIIAKQEMTSEEKALLR